MGRFYKTAKPNMIDFMYQVPEQAILGAIKGADAQLEKQEQFLTDFQKQLKLQALDPDTERQKELLKQYENQIKEYSLKISSNPLDALKQKQGIRELGNTIYQDVTRGELAAQYAQHALRQKHLEEETKRATGPNGEIRIENVNRAMAEFDRRYAAEKRDPVTGELIEKGGLNYNPVTGKYRSYSPEKLVNYFDITGEQLKYAEKWLPDVDQTFETENIQGDYYVTTKSSDKILTANNLAKGLYNLTISNPEATKSFNQEVRMFGFNDEKKLEEFKRIYGSREQPFNPFSPLKMVQVKDAEGNPVFRDMKKKDGTVEKVPVMQAEQLGEIMTSALAVAEQRDINEVKRATSLEMTDEAKMKLDVEKNYLTDLNKKKLEETMSFNTNNNEVQVSNFGINTDWKSIQDDFANTKTAINSTIQSTVNSLGSIIDGLDPTVYKDKAAMLNQIETLATNKNWKGLREYVKSKGIAGIEGIGTGVEELAQNISQLETNLKNNETVYNSLVNRVKTTKGSTKGKTFNQELAEVDKEITSAREYMERFESIPNSPGYKDGVKMLNAAKAKKNKINVAYGNAVNQEIANTNSNTKTVTISSAAETEGILTPAEASQVQNSYSNIKKNILSILNSGGNAVIVTNGKEGASTSINQLFKNNGIDLTEVIQESDGDTYKVYGKPQTFKVVGVGSAQANLQVPVTYKDEKTGAIKKQIKNIGDDAVAITVLMNDKNNKPVQSVIYMDSKDMFDPHIANFVSKMKPFTKVKSFVDDAKVKLENEVKAGGNANELYQESVDGVKYYPFSGQGGLFEFPDGTKAYGDVGKSYYVKMLGGNN
jgi:hypothetical protein